MSNDPQNFYARLQSSIEAETRREADMERRMNTAIKNEKAADKNRISLEETDERFMRGLNGENLKQRNA